MDDKGIDYVPDFWIEEEPNDLLAVSGKTRRKTRTKKIEFVGWGSRPLIDFLDSLCKDTSKQISLAEVKSIINDYVKTNNLADPRKKKRILCDQRLLSLFGKKSLARIRIDEFLEKHFAEYGSDSDDDFSYSSEENDERDRKRHKAALSSNEKEVNLKKRIQETPKSCFAAIIPANLKLLYLKRRLIEELYKDEETFDRKLVGSFVRVKSNPNDYLQKNSHQLLQVTGVKRPFGAGTTCLDILLEVSNFTDDLHVCMLSDDNFSEEECEDLHERIKSGSLKRPTTAEFREKAELLHVDITKHWLEREIHLLQNLIDRANEKGWRKELCEYLERKQLLQTPEEQKRLLLEIPKVIADELEHEATPDDESTDPPRPILRRSSPVSTDNFGATQTLATQEIDNIKASENQAQVQRVEAQKAVHITEIVDLENGKEVFSVDSQQQKRVGAMFLPPTQVVAFSVDPQQQKRAEAKFLPTQTLAFSVDPQQQKRVEAKSFPTIQIVELSDDDDDDEKEQELMTTSWHYVDPQGIVQGPFLLEILKRWSDAKYFPTDFKVFQKIGNTKPVLLSQLLLSKNL